MFARSTRISLATVFAALTAQAASYELKATPETVVVGYYWSEATPVL